MIYTPLTKKALRLCFDAHKEQLDKGGAPYVFHPFHLAEQMKDELTAVCALLHDVAEDSDITLEEIAAMGFPPEVLEALALLVHDEQVEYMDYVRAIAQNPIARRVKIADLKHNCDISRLDVVDEQVSARVKKYKQALRLLKKGERL